MSMMSDYEIWEAIHAKNIILHPFSHYSVRPASIDVTLGNQVRIVRPTAQGVIDPRIPPDDLTGLIDLDEYEFILNPGQFCLGYLAERLTLDKHIACRIEGRSSAGRLGLFVHVTAGYVDPGWDGYLTIEMYNALGRGLFLSSGLPIAHLSFYRLSGAGSSYSGRYKNDDPEPQPSKGLR